MVLSVQVILLRGLAKEMFVKITKGREMFGMRGKREIKNEFHRDSDVRIPFPPFSATH